MCDRSTGETGRGGGAPAPGGDVRGRVRRAQRGGEGARRQEAARDQETQNQKVIGLFLTF